MLSVLLLRLVGFSTLHWCESLRASVSSAPESHVERPALLCIDVQFPFSEYTYRDAMPAIEDVVHSFQRSGWPIFWKYWYFAGCGTAQGRFFGKYEFHNECKSMQQTSNFRMQSNIAIHPNSTDEYARSFLTSEFSAFHPDLIRDLRREQITKVYLIGGWWEHCITATALHARSLGFDVVIVDSAVRGSSELNPMAKYFLGNLSFRFEGVPKLPSYTQALGKTPLSFTDLAQSSHDELAISNFELATSNSELRNWIDGWFVAHWDLNSFGAKVAGDFVRFPYKRKIGTMTLVIFDACNSIGNSEHSSSGVLDLFVRKGSPVYLADTESCTTLATLNMSAGVDVIQGPTSSDILRILQTRLTSNIEQKGHTIVMVGNLADESMVALSYWMFDRDYDVFLAHDATYWRGADNAYSAVQKTQTMQVICHAVVAVGLTSDLLRLEDTPLPQSLSYFDKFILSQDSWAKVTREEEPTIMGTTSEDICVEMCDQRSMEACGGVFWDSDTQSCFMFATLPIHRLLQQPESGATIDFSIFAASPTTGLHKTYKLRVKTMQSSKKYSDNELCRL